MFGLDITVTNIISELSKDHSIRIQILLECVGTIEIHHECKEETRVFTIVQEDNYFFREMIINNTNGIRMIVSVITLHHSMDENSIDTYDWISAESKAIFTAVEDTELSNQAVLPILASSSINISFPKDNVHFVNQITIIMNICDVECFTGRIGKVFPSPLISPSSDAAQSDKFDEIITKDLSYSEHCTHDSIDNDEFLLRLMKSGDVIDMFANGIENVQDSVNTDSSLEFTDFLLDYYSKKQEQTVAIIDNTISEKETVFPPSAPKQESVSVPRKLRKSTVLPTFREKITTNTKTPHSKSLKRASELTTRNAPEAVAISARTINPVSHGLASRSLIMPHKNAKDSHFPDVFMLPEYSSLKLLVSKEEMVLMNITVPSLRGSIPEKKKIMNNSSDSSSVVFDTRSPVEPPKPLPLSYQKL